MHQASLSFHLVSDLLKQPFDTQQQCTASYFNSCPSHHWSRLIPSCCICCACMWPCVLFLSLIEAIIIILNMADMSNLITKGIEQSKHLLCWLLIWDYDTMSNVSEPQCAPACLQSKVFSALSCAYQWELSKPSAVSRAWFGDPPCYITLEFKFHVTGSSEQLILVCVQEKEGSVPPRPLPFSSLICSLFLLLICIS